MSLTPLFKKKPWRRALEPRAEFLTQGRAVFLTAFRARYAHGAAMPASLRRAHPALFRIGVSFAALIVAYAGATAYADAANVNPDSIFYPLKRSHEFAQLALARGAAAPQLRVRFAKRRLREIEHLEEVSPSSSEAEALAQEFHEDVKISLASMENGAYSQKNMGTYCASLEELVEAKSPVSARMLVEHPNIAVEFDKYCASFVEPAETANVSL